MKSSKKQSILKATDKILKGLRVKKKELKQPRESNTQMLDAYVDRAQKLEIIRSSHQSLQVASKRKSLTSAKKTRADPLQNKL